MSIPVGLLQWIEAHAEEFRPPVSNRVVWPDSEFVFMVVRGPNARSDFHVDPGDEIFMQLRGEIRVDVIEDGVLEVRRVGEGEIMLVPAGIPHRPLRPEGTWGLVIERQRRPDELDTIFWRCPRCEHRVNEVRFHVSDIETELASAMHAFNASPARRTCGNCGTRLRVPEAFGPESEGDLDVPERAGR